MYIASIGKVSSIYVLVQQPAEKEKLHHQRERYQHANCKGKNIKHFTFVCYLVFGSCLFNKLIDSLTLLIIFARFVALKSRCELFM